MNIARIEELLHENDKIAHWTHHPIPIAEARHLLRCAEAIAALESKGGCWVFRDFESGRGWRLHQSFSGGRDTYPDPLTAIEAALASAREGGA